jgi:signal transduction histidine kinase
VRDEDGRIVLLLPEGRDITEKRRAEAELASKNQALEALVARVQELDATRSRFFANIRHELRPPLTHILDPVSTLLRADNLDAEQRALLGVVQRNAAQLLRRVQELLDVSKLDAQQMTLSCAPLDLGQLARACAANFSALVEQRAISIQIDAPPLIVHADGGKIERVLLNLLANALRFTPPAGRLHIALSLVDGLPTLIVEDSGPGVPDDMRERIFERFQQGDHQHGGRSPGGYRGIERSQ